MSDWRDEIANLKPVDTEEEEMGNSSANTYKRLADTVRAKHRGEATQDECDAAKRAVDRMRRKS